MIENIPSPEIKDGILICFYPADSRGWDEIFAAARRMYPDYRGNTLCLPWPAANKRQRVFKGCGVNSTKAGCK
jgi:hypothetical protein